VSKLAGFFSRVYRTYFKLNDCFLNDAKLLETQLLIIDSTLKLLTTLTYSNVYILTNKKERVVLLLELVVRWQLSVFF
jgi:hypothetical protein